MHARHVCWTPAQSGSRRTASTCETGSSITTHHFSATFWHPLGLSTAKTVAGHKARARDTSR